ncbi:hypothetical protein GCM10010873_01410 [Cypionkella aquatica]|uniref:Uncharacterized protein n=1 Tax=Cypionkella aquatica TaxID=1756042 RepID=A0AA37TQI3_9RHOB|nr:hypothetical protein GCM10010873_01410 [Cypionkella aquatica]
MAIDAVFTLVDGHDPAFLANQAALAHFTPPPPLDKWQTINLGRRDASVTAALTAASAAGADPFWVGYHRLRLLRLAGQEAQIAALVAEIVQTGAHVESLLRLGREWRESGHAPMSLQLHVGLRSVRPLHGPTAMAWADLALGLGETGEDIEAAL